MSTKLNFIPWKNNFNQTIQPGARVLVVTTCYGHSLYIREGKFAGVTDAGLASVYVEFDTYQLTAGGKYVRVKKTKRTTPSLQRIFALA